MPVVINEFEVLAEPSSDAGRAAPQGGGEAAPEKPIEPCALAAALRTLDDHSLRIWAH